MRYLRLWLDFFKMSWMADIEYRLNFLVRVTGEIVWYMTQLSVFEVLYTHTQTISGWDVHAMRVFMGSLFLADGIYQILFSQNLEHFFTLVRKGDLDLYLTKPINSQFMVSCQRVAVANTVNLTIVMVYLIWAILHLGHPVGGFQVATFGLLIVSGLVISYAMHFMFATLNVIFQDFSAVQFIWYQLYRLATRPDPIYPSFLRLIVMTVFPVAFFASVPARVLVEGFSSTMLMASLGLSVGLLSLSNLFWEMALRRYASASS